MNIIIDNADEVGMPTPMADHCRKLIARRIENTHDQLPEPGADVTILYSENDPLGETLVQDDAAYFIYFAVEDATAGTDGGLQEATIRVSIIV